MSNIRTVSKNIGTSGTATGWRFYVGAGALEALVVNFSASADGSTVVTAYDGQSATGTSIYTQTGNTDLGTSVPVFLAGDADIVDGTSTAGVGHSLIFSDGLYIEATADVAGPQVVTAFIRPLVKKSVNVVGASGTAPIFNGPALWKGYSIKLDPYSPSGLDITFTDESSPNQSGATVMTKSNYAITPGTKTVRKVVTTTGETEAGAAVTTAATGSYGCEGIYLTTGLSVTLAQGTANQVVSIDALFEV